MTEDRRENRRGNRLVRGAATLVLVNCLLLLPLWIRFGGIGPHWLALEAGLLVSVFLLLPRGRWTTLLAGAAALVTLGATGLLIADTTTRMSLARPLNLYLDAQLLGSVRNLLDGAFGQGWGIVVLFGAVVLAVAVTIGLTLLLAGLGERRHGLRPRVPALILLGILVVLVPLRWAHPRGVVLGLPVTQLVKEQEAQLTRMLEERDRFGGEMTAARASWAGQPGLMRGLGGRDVVLAFVESYGTSALEDARYAPVVRPGLDELARVARDRGLHVATGRFVAPSQGGMSWLGHGSAVSGLWLDNQLRYDLLLAGGRPTLIDDMEAAGYRTAALMPQITMAWPEGGQFGYDRIWTRKDIDYRGPPLNWVEMPDQFTWSFLQHQVLPWSGDAPVFVEMSLVSSHAPWTPVIELEPWDAIGTGEIFERWDTAGESPESLWRDHDRVREYYARSVRYAVDAMTGWVERYMDDDIVLIAMGDHQPAPMITGEGAARTVPVHVISTDSSIVAPFLDRGFAYGVFPPDASPDAPAPPRMSLFREWFVTAMSDSSSTLGPATDR